MRSKTASEIKRMVEELEHKKGSDYYIFGFNYFGPFLFGFTKWLYESIHNKGLDNILFFARDGYMMQKAYDLMDSQTKTQYVYFSRQSLRQALLCQAKDYEDSLKYFSWKRYVSIAELLYFWGFDSWECADLIDNENLHLSDEYKFEELSGNSELSELYSKLKNEIFDRSLVQASLLSRYIKQIGLNDRSAIVDIGWHGNMQYYLEQFLNVNGLNSSLKGFYVGIESARKINGTLNGYLYSKEDLSMRKSTLCFFGIYEKLFQSLEGSTIGYIDVNGVVDAAKAEYEYINDQSMISHIIDMQEGAMDCYTQLCNSNLNIKDYKDYALPLLLYGENPSLKEALLFKDIYNTDGIKTYFLPQKPISHYRFNEFKRDLSNSSWKTGFMKAAFKIPFPYYLIYKSMKK